MQLTFAVLMSWCRASVPIQSFDRPKELLPATPTVSIRARSRIDVDNSALSTDFRVLPESSANFEPCDRRCKTSQVTLDVCHGFRANPTPDIPVSRVATDAGTNHIQVNAARATQQVRAAVAWDQASVCGLTRASRFTSFSQGKSPALVARTGHF
jgi:hypothetical protein